MSPQLRRLYEIYGGSKRPPCGNGENKKTGTTLVVPVLHVIYISSRPMMAMPMTIITIIK